MTTFFLFGKYNPNSLRKISSKRTQEANTLVEKNGGKISSGFVLLGEYDLLLKTEFTDIQSALKSSVELSKLLGIGFTTAPAVSIDEFDRLIG